MHRQIIELLKEKKINGIREILSNKNSKDIAIMFRELNTENTILLFRILPKEIAAEVFTDMSHYLQEKLVHAMTDSELKAIMGELFTDDTVDLIEEMPANVVKRILNNIEPSDRNIINEFLNYPAESAGSIMTNEFIDLKENMNVEEAFTRIRQTGIDKETIYNCYVLDENRKLIGLVSVRDLLLSDKHLAIKDIMKTHIIYAHTLEDREKVARKIQKYNFLALPIVDSENRLVGIVTVDDAVNVLQEENTEDFHKMAAMTPVIKGYFNVSAFSHAKHRIIWLLLLMISASITGAIITRYEQAFTIMPLLVSFIPMIMDTGGNSGSQASTLIIRGLVTEEIKTKDIFKIMMKETKVAIIIGIVLSILNGIRIVLQYNDYILAVVVGVTLICTILSAKLLGAVLPIAAKKLRIDPAIMAVPLITTIVDTMSIFIYFNFAMWLMNI